MVSSYNCTIIRCYVMSAWDFLPHKVDRLCLRKCCTLQWERGPNYRREHMILLSNQWTAVALVVTPSRGGQNRHCIGHFVSVHCF